MLRKWMLAVCMCVVLIAGVPACGGDSGGDSQEGALQRAEEGKPLGRRDKARLEEMQENAAEQPAENAQGQ